MTTKIETTAKASTDASEREALEALGTVIREADGESKRQQGIMDGARIAQGVARVYGARAAHALMSHALVGGKLLTASKLAGVPRTTLRNYVDAGALLDAIGMADAITEPTDKERNTVNAVWEAKADEAKARREGKPKTGMEGQGQFVDATEDTLPEPEELRASDVLRAGNEFLATVKAFTAAGGKLPVDKRATLEAWLLEVKGLI